PRPYRGKLTLIWPSERPEIEEAFVDSRAEWAKMALGGVESHELVGTHHSIFLEPRVSELASLVAAILERARAAAGA
ncbi:MAG TPA: hypothetical protein VKA84_27050, partial [Gemmatimonadaceae bacterium]|nr:hypothetical protein [Gemmatimonadaceae bacterium]